MGSGRVRAVVGAGVAVVVVAVVLVFVLGRGGATAEPVQLESAAQAGPDPFTGSVTAREVAPLPEPVVAAAAEVTATLIVDDATGTRSAPGVTPGLYGGTRDEQACDAVALAMFLADAPAKSEAWAGVLGIEVDGIEAYLAGLTPVLLTSDTLVTNHGFVDGRATPRQSVLQAGTAVMVDDAGVPRVRCSCGNPLTEPEAQELAGASVEGGRWDGYDSTRVTVVTPGEPTEVLTLIDVESAERFEQPVGSSIGSTWIVVAGSTAADPAPPSGRIHTSPDGVDWTVALDTTTPLRGVATSRELAVVVGNDGRGGVVHTSADGATWSDAVTVVDPLVAVAHGDGRWVAVGDRSFAEEGGEGDGSAGAIYSSVDGSTWERVATTSPYENSSLTALGGGGILHQAMVSVAHGDGQWIATARECTERICQVVEFTSPDATTWTRKVLDGALTNAVVAHDGEAWGFVGSEGDEGAPGADSMGGPPPNVGVAGTSPDGTTWSFGPTEPDRIVLEGLSADAVGWLAVQDTAMSPDPVPERDGIYRSADLATWTEVSTIEDDLHGIAVLGRAYTAPAPVAAPTTTAAPVITSDAAGIRVLTRGLQFQDADGMDTTMALFAEPATSAISTITAVLGPPARTVESGDGTCVAESVVLRWGALILVVPGTQDSGSDWQVVLRGTAAELPAMPVTVAGEFTLGSSAADVGSYFPGVPRSAFAHQGTQYETFLLDPSGAETDPGTLVAAENGTVATISAPEYLEDLC